MGVWGDLGRLRDDTVPASRALARASTRPTGHPHPVDGAVTQGVQSMTMTDAATTFDAGRAFRALALRGILSALLLGLLLLL